MFEETLRLTSQLQRGIQVRVPMPTDKKGCLDRQCPSKECRKFFKVVYADWRGKVSDTRAFCPYCRFEKNPQRWNTASQDRYIREWSKARLSEMLDSALKSDARRHNSSSASRIRGGLIDISLRMEVKTDARPFLIPLKLAEELQQDFTCEKCQCRWSSLGSSFYCPACGHNSAVVEFERTLNVVRGIINRLPEILKSLTSKDEIEDTSRNFIEGQLGKLVGAFERMNEVLSDRVLPAKRPPKKGAVFQRVDDASDWWRMAVGVGFDQWLKPKEVDRLRLLYQRRHLLVHRQGVVDQKYLTVSGDRAYSVEQRIAVRGEDILELADLQ